MILSQVVQNVLVGWWQEILLDFLEELALCHDSDTALVCSLVTKSWSVQ